MHTNCWSECNVLQWQSLDAGGWLFRVDRLHLEIEVTTLRHGRFPDYTPAGHNTVCHLHDVCLPSGLSIEPGASHTLSKQCPTTESHPHPQGLFVEDSACEGSRGATLGKTQQYWRATGLMIWWFTNKTIVIMITNLYQIALALKTHLTWHFPYNHC